MDPRILEAMVKMPIDPEEGVRGPTFTLEDAKKMMPGYAQPQQTTVPVPPQYVTESVYPPVNTHYNGERIITMTESELDAKIKSALLEFMTTTFTKTLTETTIKKTIGTLIKEGKIRVKQK